jgi:cytochrome c oxidase cbb3-type subunit 4
VTLFGIELDTLRGILLVLLMLAFIGLWAWAWSSKRKDRFRAASRLPLEEDQGQIPADDEQRGAKE